MNDINQILKDLEFKYNINIIYAVRLGSFEKRTNHKYSDIDVVFIYTRELIDYFKIDKVSLTITEKVANYDLNGFDVTKFFKHVSQSNINFITVFQSKTIYKGKLKNLAIDEHQVYNRINYYKVFSAISSIVKNNYKEYIQSKTKVSNKKYKTILYHVLQGYYLIIFKKLPPLNYDKIITMLIRFNQKFSTYQKYMDDLLFNINEGNLETTHIKKLDELITEFINIDRNPFNNLKDNKLKDYCNNAIKVIFYGK